jgi:hypothetical protein
MENNISLLPPAAARGQKPGGWYIAFALHYQNNRQTQVEN